jgi:hypothetical protein
MKEEIETQLKLASLKLFSIKLIVANVLLPVNSNETLIYHTKTDSDNG